MLASAGSGPLAPSVGGGSPKLGAVGAASVHAGEAVHASEGGFGDDDVGGTEPAHLAAKTAAATGAKVLLAAESPQTQAWQRFLKEKAEKGFTVADRLRYAYIDYRHAEGFFASAKAWILGGGLGALVAGSMQKDSDKFKDLEKRALFYKEVCKAEQCFTKLVRKIPFISSPNQEKLEKAMQAFEALLDSERGFNIPTKTEDYIRAILDKKAGVASFFTGTLLEYYAQVVAGDDMNSISAFFKDESYLKTLRDLHKKGYRGVASENELELNKTRLEGLEEDGTTPTYAEHIRPLIVSFERGFKRGMLKDDNTLNTLGRTTHALTFIKEGLEKRMKKERSDNNRAVEAYFNGETDELPVINGMPAATRAAILDAADKYRAARNALANQEAMSDEANRLRDAAERELDLFLDKKQAVRVALQDLTTILDGFIPAQKAADELDDGTDNDGSDTASRTSFVSEDSSADDEVDAGIFQAALRDRILFKKQEARIQLLQGLIDSKDGAVVLKQMRPEVIADCDRMDALAKEKAEATAGFRKKIKDLEAKQAKLNAKQHSFSHDELLETTVEVVSCPALQQAVEKGQELRATFQDLSQRSLKATDALSGVASDLQEATRRDLPEGVRFAGGNFVLDITKDMYDKDYFEDRKIALQQEAKKTLAHIDTIIHIGRNNGVVFRKTSQFKTIRKRREAVDAVEQDRLKEERRRSLEGEKVSPEGPPAASGGLDSHHMGTALDALQQLEQQHRIDQTVLGGEPDLDA